MKIQIIEVEIIDGLPLEVDKINLQTLTQHNSHCETGEEFPQWIQAARDR